MTLSCKGYDVGNLAEIAIQGDGFCPDVFNLILADPFMGNAETLANLPISKAALAHSPSAIMSFVADLFVGHFRRQNIVPVHAHFYHAGLELQG